MKPDENKTDDEDIRPEYKREDLGAGARGKYFAEYTKGANTITVHHADGTSTSTIVERRPPMQNPIDGGE